MLLNVDLRHPVPRPGAPLEDSADREPAHANDGVASPVASGTARYSFEAECECPDECLRDHEND